MKQILITALLLLSINSFSQSKEDYPNTINKAWGLYEKKDYEASAKKYEDAFSLLDGRANELDRYNAACSHSLAGNVNRSFYHLFYLADHEDIRYMNYDHISQDSDLNLLHDDNLWKILLSRVESNKKEYEKNFDHKLVAILKDVYELDQGFRHRLDDIEKEHGRNSKEMDQAWKEINKTDSANLDVVTGILDKHGWLGSDVIGKQGNSTLFLVIQHADLETQLKYAPMMKEAVSQGKAHGSSYAMLEDRIALRQGKRQIYGSQIGMDPKTGKTFVSPLIEPEKVNERRAEVGLPPIEQYTQYFEFEWNLEEHIENTKRLEKEQAKRKKKNS